MMVKITKITSTCIYFIITCSFLLLPCPHGLFAKMPFVFMKKKNLSISFWKDLIFKHQRRLVVLSLEI